MPMAMAGFDSIGQKPEPVKAVCLDPFLPCFPMKKEEGAGRQETKKKTLLQVARGTHKHQRTGFFNDNVVANCYANEERLDTPSGRAAGSRSTKYD